MNEQGQYDVQAAGEMIRGRLASMGMSQVELANRCSEHVQVISAILNGQREIPIPLSVKLDCALELEQGSIAVAQARYLAFQEAQNLKIPDMQSRKRAVLEKIKAAGGFWSYQGIPEHLDDDDIIEAALVHLELEDLPMLQKIWSKSHLKRVWKERLVSQGKRMNILNYILAVKLFGVRHPDKYLIRYAH
ncbi:MAG: helix-turn-helix transcriptional regulator [Bacteroidales bacterium]|nr:helix-turn-helix transcriptional regulator [Bacteroidales bacterium]